MDPGYHSQIPIVFVNQIQMIGKGTPSFNVQVPSHLFKISPYSFGLMSKKSVMNHHIINFSTHVWQFYKFPKDGNSV